MTLPIDLDYYRSLTPPWGEIGYIVYKRTYARPIGGGKKEEWVDTLWRVVNGLKEIEAPLTDDELVTLFDHMFHLRGTVSGRALWQLGTDTVRRLGADSMNNCWHVTVDEPSAFCFAFNELMLGGGVGYNITAEHVYSLPKVLYAPTIERVDTTDCDFIVPDNREGWVELLWRVLKAHFETGQDFRYNTSSIRAKGKPIHSFGGTASGSEDLVKGIQQIAEIIGNRVDNKLRPVDCLDIMNIIGQIVVSGNVRRSAQIAIGDAYDVDFLQAKRWDLIKMPPWRAMSNNSINTDTMATVPECMWEGYQGKGEPYGLLNVPLARRFGRLGDERPDPSIEGFNPCAEVPLASRESCNLAEIFLPNIESVEQWKEVAGLLYKACKGITNVPYADPYSQEIVNQNRKIGVGVTGYYSSQWVGEAEAFDAVYDHLRELDVNTSWEMGINESIRLTTVKPSGTLSLLPRNCTPGMHAAFSQFMVKGMRIASDDPLVDLCRNKGYHIEPRLHSDGSIDENTMVIDFPVRIDAVSESELSAIDSLETQRFLQTHWADNSVSATHYYRKEELPDIRQWLEENYTDSVKSCSFLLASGHGFRQAPLRPITEEEYLEMVSQVEPITSEVVGDHALESMECEGGACPVK